ncbi:MAG: phenylalanine--tRNA ligase beta subunit-related protein [Thermomicrobiales bacterium]
MRLIVEEAFRELFPDAVIGIVVATGIDNRRAGDEAQALLAAATTAAIGDSDLATSPPVAVWRDAYRRFGLKPSRYRAGIEGLLRAARGDGVRSVSPLVDLYNAVSLRHLLPCGGEDLAAIEGDIRLTRATGTEPFVPLGAVDNLPPEPGEVIYADDLGVICRAWNWREAERTKLTPETTRAVLVIEALPPRTTAEVQSACEDLAALVSAHLAAQCRVSLLGRQSAWETSLDA